MDSKDWRGVGAMVVDCTVRLFGTFGAELRYTGSPDPIPAADQLTVAVIGLASEALRGSLVMGATPKVLELTHPLRTEKGGHLDNESLRDWAGELANRLVGRVKIQLLTHGITIQLGTPTTMSGRELTLGAALKNPECLPHCFEIGDDWLLVRMEAVAHPETKLSDDPKPVPATDEGGMLIF
ncbi:MAG TPA: chemotaxis protein CheX [Polyangiaceae bacterium]|nr:chemotaxis protein CheX [Polyangiaceae bacterium]